MKTLKLMVALSILLSTGACFLWGSGPKVPAASAGTVPLTVYNTFDHTIWNVILWPDGAPLDATNWLGIRDRASQIEPGKSYTFSVKAGTYRYMFMFWNQNHEEGTRYLSTSFTREAPKAQPPIRIDGPTYLYVGDNATAKPPEGFVSIVVPVVDTFGAAPANCKGDGEIPSGDDCCSRLVDTQTGRCSASNE